MRLMDEHFLHHPFKVAKRMHVWLTKDIGYQVNHIRVERLYYDGMGLRAVMPGKHTSRRCKDHKVYPYLLRNMDINEVNQVWAMDITYIPMRKGFTYLTAIIDLYSRYVVGWSVSNSMDAEWCQQTLQEAFSIHGKLGIINTDQGSQFTSMVFTDYVLKDLEEVKLSMDEERTILEDECLRDIQVWEPRSGWDCRATDNALIERLWRSVKYEKLYLNPSKDGLDLYDQLSDYFDYYNHRRRHSIIDDHKPIDLYSNQLKVAA